MTESPSSYNTKRSIESPLSSPPNFSHGSPISFSLNNEIALGNTDLIETDFNDSDLASFSEHLLCEQPLEDINIPSTGTLFDSLDKITECDSDTQLTDNINPSINYLHTSVLPIKELITDLKSKKSEPTSADMAPRTKDSSSTIRPKEGRVKHLTLELQETLTSAPLMQEFADTILSPSDCLSPAPEIYLPTPLDSEIQRSIGTEKLLKENLLSPTSELSSSFSDMLLCNSNQSLRRPWLEKRPHSFEKSCFADQGRKPSTGFENIFLGGKIRRFSSLPDQPSCFDQEANIFHFDSEEPNMKKKERLKPMLSQCIKKELRCKIQLGRLKAGKKELCVEFAEAKAEPEMSLDEIRQRNELKEKNRKHAQRSREKFREQRKNEEMKYLELIKTNQKLRRQKFKLQQQVRKLQQVLKEHPCQMKSLHNAAT